MRYLFWLWFMPLSLFWGWYGLSFYDINFGMLFLSRELHDMVFHIYGSLLGVDPGSIPGMFLKACIFDSFLIFGIIAFRRRKKIKAWWNERRASAEAVHSEAPAPDRPVQVPAE